MQKDILEGAVISVGVRNQCENDVDSVPSDAMCYLTFTVPIGKTGRP